MEIRKPADQLPNNAKTGCISSHAADGNEGPQGSIVEAGHSSTTLLSGSRGGRDEFYFRFPCGLERWPRYDLPSNR